MPVRARRRATPEATACSSGGTAPRRRTLSQPRTRRQTTLTQYERGTPFAVPTVDDSEDEFDEPRPKKRSRRSILPGKTESQNTLTQIGWISTIPPSDSDEDENLSEASGAAEPNDDPPSDEEEPARLDAGEDNRAAVPASDEEFNRGSDGETAGLGGAEDDKHGTRQKESQVHGEMNINEKPGKGTQVEPGAGSEQHQSRPEIGKPPPHTPRKARLLEVPSSQSPPVTPLSAIHTHERRRLLRSPLRSLSTNPRSLSDSPSRARKSTVSPIRRSIRKTVAFKDQASSSTHERLPRSPISSEVADSEDDYSEEEEEDGDNGDVVDAVAGIDIGQETQAYIRRIDFNCTSTRATADPHPGQASTQKEDIYAPRPESSANRSFNFDERQEASPQPPQIIQREQAAPAPSQDATLPSTHTISPSSPASSTHTIKQEPETQPQLWHTTRDQHQHQDQHPISSPVLPLSQATTTITASIDEASRVQPSPRPPINSDNAIVSASSLPHSSYPTGETYPPETYHTYASADDHIPSSQPTQLHLKQILLQPSTQMTQAEDDEDEEQERDDRVPDSQSTERRRQEDEIEDDEEMAPGASSRTARRGRGVKGLVTATQLMMQAGGGGDEYSLPPPPPWSQETEDETENEM